MSKSNTPRWGIIRFACAAICYGTFAMTAWFLTVAVDAISEQLPICEADFQSLTSYSTGKASGMTMTGQQTGVANLTAVGVFHTYNGLQTDGDRITRAVQDADLVLLEAGPYFEQISAYALRQGKQATFIDTDDEAPITQAFMLLCLAPIVAAVFVHTAQRRRVYVTATAIGFVLAHAGYIPGPYSVYHLGTSSTYNGLDLNVMADGRTVHMFETAKAIAASNPDRKVLFIAGDYHVKGIAYYRQKPTFYAFKTAVYRPLAWSTEPLPYLAVGQPTYWDNEATRCKPQSEAHQL